MTKYESPAPRRPGITLDANGRAAWFNPAFIRQAVLNVGSQAELARLLGCSRETVRLWCDGHSIPDDEHIALIAEAAGLAPDSAWCEPELPAGPLDGIVRRLTQHAHVSLRTISAATGIALGTLSEIQNGKRTATAQQETAVREFARDRLVCVAGMPLSSSWAARERGRRSIRRCSNVNLPDDAVRFFRLKDDPWRLDVREDRDVFITRDYERMHKLVTRAVERRDFAVVAGPTGSGKSQMARRIIREITRRKRVKLVPIVAPDVKQINSSTIMDALVKNLAPGTRPEVRTEKLAIQVCSILIAHHAAGNLPVLLIDDAHRCTPTTLGQLKRFHEFRDIGGADPYEPLLCIILLGWPELSLTLRNNADLLEVARRADMVELRGLRGEHADYVKRKLARVGANGHAIFEPAAIKALASLPQAQWPLPTNHICARAMFLAWEERATRPKKDQGVVTAADIKHAAEEVL